MKIRVLAVFAILAVPATPAAARGDQAPLGTVAGPATESCVIDGNALVRSDARLARAACEAAQARFGALVGGPVPSVLVLVDNRAGYRTGILEGHAVVLWPSSEAMRASISGPADAVADWKDRQWREVLPHEIGHAMTATFFYPEGRFQSTGYGTPLPDWFEEAVAIWMEPHHSRDGRLAAARRLPAERLDIEKIVTMRHPAAGNAEILAVRDGAAVPLEPEVWDFYQQSVAVLAFIHDMGGRRAVRDLAIRLMADPTDPNAIVGLTGLPADLEEVAAAWRRWLGVGSVAAGAGSH